MLNGHIHQVMQKVEGHVSFHTAMSTAFPQPAPGSAPSPGPMKVEADRLKKLLGLSRMSFHDVNHPIAITDVPLEEDLKAAGAGAKQVVVDNFSFAPAMAAVKAGSTVTWINHDDVPHIIMSTDQKFKSPVLDTDEQFSHTFDAPGTYRYLLLDSSKDDRPGRRGVNVMRMPYTQSLGTLAVAVVLISHRPAKGADPVTVEFVAPAAGQYEIACSEFCGIGHHHHAGQHSTTQTFR